MIQEYYIKILEKNKWKNRKFIDYVISLLEKEWTNKNVFIIEAPTGYGKSTISQAISLYSINEELKVIIAFPLRTLLEDQYEKFKKITEENFLGKRYMHNLNSRYLVKPITLTTIDTLSLTIFGIPPEEFEKVAKEQSLGHYLFSHSSVLFSNIILDEVHLLSDSTKSINFLVLLIHLAIANNLKLIFMSATIPPALINVISRFFENKKEKLSLIRFKENCDEEFIRERLRKNYKVFLHALKESEKFNKIVELLTKSPFKKAIVIFNTVEDAISFYKLLVNLDLNSKKVLLHSRFNEIDRERKIMELNEIKKLNEYLIISTQTIESGVDISSNLIITELAPANSLIQRLGRFLRYENEYEGEVHIWFEVNEEGKIKSYMNKYKVYDLKLVEKTLEILKKQNLKINFHVPESYENLLKDVYDESEFEINKSIIDEYNYVLSNIEKLSQSALDLFIKMEGSFVRDEMPIPVITEEIYNYVKSSPNKIANYAVPISIEILKKIKPKNAIKIDGEKIEIKIDNNKMKRSEKWLKFLLKNDVAALIVEGKYDEEIGLVIKQL
jgi:CRISPR-associated endonuclease/helicase Cas3